MDALIKNIDEISWKKFKIEAIKQNKNLGEFFSDMIKEISSRKGNWDLIKKSKASLTKKDADEINKTIKSFRKDFNFRY